MSTWNKFCFTGGYIECELSRGGDVVRDLSAALSSHNRPRSLLIINLYSTR